MTASGGWRVASVLGWGWVGLVGALVHAGEAVVPAQAFIVEPSPKEAEAQRGCGEEGSEDAAAHGLACGVFVGEGAEGDAGVVHAGGGFAEGEEEQVVDGPEEGEGGGDGDGCDGEGDGDGLGGAQGAGGEACGGEVGGG